MTSFLPDLSRHEDEKYYTDTKHAGKKLPFPSIHDQPTLDLSVIIPAYNEQDRCKFCVEIVFGAIYTFLVGYY